MIKKHSLERYSRQIYFKPIGQEGQKKLLKSKVTLIGCGALGSVIANNLVRSGVGELKIIDRDFIEKNNLQRQILFDEKDIKQNLPKAVAAKKKLSKINSEVKISAYVEDVTHQNIESFIKDADLVMDGSDNLYVRFLINDACIKLNKPWIYSAVISSYGYSMPIIPFKTPCFRCYLINLPQAGTMETCDVAGIISPVINIIASYSTVEAFKILTGNFKSLNTNLLAIDVWERIFEQIRLVRNQDCICCEQKYFEFLTGEKEQRIVSLCGRDTIHIRGVESANISLPELAKKLEKQGPVTYNEFMLKFIINKYEIVIFPNARAIIKGTNDKVVAKKLYGKYIGF